MKQPKFNFNLTEFLEKLRDVSQERKTPGRGLSIWVIALITLAAMFVYFFFALPSLSPQGSALYSFLAGGIVLFTALRLLLGRPKPGLKELRTTALVVIVLFVFPIVMSLLSSPVFHAKSYANLIDVQPGVFSEDIQRISISQIPIVDRETASIIGEKQMGAIAELVSQFEIDANYAQINIGGKPIRVSPIKYFDIIKYIANFRDGLQYYISVDMTNQEGDLVKLNNPIMYSSSDYLMRNIHRKIRFQYPFLLLGATNFELDDNGEAYYVTPVLTKRIFFFGGIDAKGAIITNAHTGESVIYDTADVPEWVDRVYPSELIMSQLDMRGLYQGGFFNSLIGQRNVTRTTEGYNYISLDTDIYQVTGVTSVRADTSNLGFYYINLRTKETKFYSVPSATEISAMASAKGAVQEKNYNPTFPVLLNLGGDPVYFMSLKDAAKVAKLYALVDAVDFTKVIVKDTVSDALRVYASEHPVELGEGIGSAVEKRITIKEIHEVVIDGNTIYYFLVNEDQDIYSVLAKDIGNLLVFAKPGDAFQVTGVLSEGEVNVHTLEK